MCGGSYSQRAATIRSTCWRARRSPSNGTPRLTTGWLRGSLKSARKFWAEGGEVVRAYQVLVERGRSKRWWLINVPEVSGAHTQARRLDQVEEVSRDLIVLMDEGAPASFEIEVVVQLPETVRNQLDRSAEMFQEAARFQAQAAALVRDAAFRLHHEEGLAFRDVGRVLGVSFQRAKQLVDEASPADGVSEPARRTTQSAARVARVVRGPADALPLGAGSRAQPTP